MNAQLWIERVYIWNFMCTIHSLWRLFASLQHFFACYMFSPLAFFSSFFFFFFFFICFFSCSTLRFSISTQHISQARMNNIHGADTPYQPTQRHSYKFTHSFLPKWCRKNQQPTTTEKYCSLLTEGKLDSRVALPLLARSPLNKRILLLVSFTYIHLSDRDCCVLFIPKRWWRKKWMSERAKRGGNSSNPSNATQCCAEWVREIEITWIPVLQHISNLPVYISCVSLIFMWSEKNV